MDVLYWLWMLLGVVGFPASVGWTLHCWQKYRQVTTDYERVRRREKLRKAEIIMIVFLIILVCFVVASLMMFGEAPPAPLPTETITP